MTRHLVFSLTHHWFLCEACHARSLFIPPLEFSVFVKAFRRFAREHVGCARRAEVAA